MKRRAVYPAKVTEEDSAAQLLRLYMLGVAGQSSAVTVAAADYDDDACVRSVLALLSSLSIASTVSRRSGLSRSACSSA